jgi:hypothetical protein
MHNTIEQIEDIKHNPIALWRIPVEALPQELWRTTLSPGEIIVVNETLYEIKAFSLGWYAYIARRVD